MGSYVINDNSSKKTLQIVTEGFFSVTDGTNCINDYKLAARKINVKEYALEVDASKQSVGSQDVKVLMLDAMKFYASAGFKSVTLKTGTNAILKMQCSALAKANKLDITVI